LLQDFQAQFAASGASVIAVSPNDLESLRSLAAQLKLSYPLAADPQLTLARAYSIVDGDGPPRRSVFVIDTDGIVILALENYHPANISQLEAIFLALELVEESPPMLERPGSGSFWQRLWRR
jgi:peroxiredoxin